MLLVISTYLIRVTTPKLVKLQILHRLPLMKSEVDELLHAAQMKYKKYFDKLLRNLSTFKPGQRVYEDRPPPLTPGKEVYDQTNCRLVPKAVGPIRIVKIVTPTATTDEHSIPYAVSVSRVYLAFSPVLSV